MPDLEEDLRTGPSWCALCRDGLSTTQDILCVQASKTELATAANGDRKNLPRCNKVSCPACGLPRRPPIWWHRECADILASSYELHALPTFKDVQDLGRAFAPYYTARHQEFRDLASIREGLFSEHASPVLGRHLQVALCQLPEEILLEILELIGSCRYLTILGESRRILELYRRTRLDLRDLLTVSTGFYYTRAWYQAVPYVTRISELASSYSSLNESFAEEVFVPLNPDAQVIVLSRDHLGVCNIQFVKQISDAVEDGSPWYERICSSNRLSGETLQLSYKGLFLEDLRCASNQMIISRSSWSSPSGPVIQPWNFHAEKLLTQKRYHFVQIGAQTKGLAVCNSDRSTIGVHAFSGNMDEYREFAKEMKLKYSIRYLRWMYFPINPGEEICGFWIRRLKGVEGVGWDPNLVILTSRGRSRIFGPLPSLKLRSNFIYYPLLRPNDGTVSGIYHDGLDPSVKTIEDFGVTCHPHRSKFEALTLPSLDAFTPPVQTMMCPYFFSLTKARLEGLLEVQYCRAQDTSQQRCIGLLLYYENGSIESLGQVRLDEKISKKIVCPLSLQRDVKDRLSYVKNVKPTKDIPHERFNCDWLHLPSKGTLVWWFSRAGDEIMIQD